MNGSLRYAGDVFDEFARLQQQLNQVFGRSATARSIRALARGSSPAVNIGKTAQNIEILVFAPGIERKDFEITVEKGVLIIAAQRNGAADLGAKGSTIYARERFTGSFRRVISLPEDADPARVEATYRDGILRITVARQAQAQPRLISVQ